MNSGPAMIRSRMCTHTRDHKSLSLKASLLQGVTFSFLVFLQVWDVPKETF